MEVEPDNANNTAKSKDVNLNVNVNEHVETITASILKDMLERTMDNEANFMQKQQIAANTIKQLESKVKLLETKCNNLNVVK